MQSGVGSPNALRQNGIEVVADLPGVGANLQDHIGFTCVWEFPQAWPVTWLPEISMYWHSRAEAKSPDLFATFGAAALSSPECSARYAMPDAGWNLFGALARPRSRGTVELTGPNPEDPVRLNTNYLSHPDDLRAAKQCIEMLREIGNSVEVRPFVKREVAPGTLSGRELESYIRQAAMTYWHFSGTAKMGSDSMSVVDGQLRVHGVSRLRVADASIMPTVTTGNTMAPCVVVGERAAVLLKHGRPWAPNRAGTADRDDLL